MVRVAETRSGREEERPAFNFQLAGWVDGQVRYVPPEGTFFLAILTRLGEAFRFEDLESYNCYVTPTSEAQRLRTALELFEAGLRMMRVRYRRMHPDASPPEIESMVSDWLLQRPGAQSGDAEGRSITWPRSQ